MVAKRIRLGKEETYLIINHKGESTEAIEINFRKGLIKIYDNMSWVILPMNKDQQFNPRTRIIKHIDELRKGL